MLQQVYGQSTDRDCPSTIDSAHRCSWIIRSFLCREPDCRSSVLVGVCRIDSTLVRLVVVVDYLGIEIPESSVSRINVHQFCSTGYLFIVILALRYQTPML